MTARVNHNFVLFYMEQAPPKKPTYQQKAKGLNIFLSCYLKGLGFGLAATSDDVLESAVSDSLPPSSPSSAVDPALVASVITEEDLNRPGYQQAVEILKKTPIIDG